MQPEALQTEPPQPRGMSDFARIPAVFFEPKAAFADIAARPTWILPIVLVIVFSIAVSALIGSHIGWERIGAAQIAASPSAGQMTPEAKATAIRFWSNFGPVIGYAGSIILPPISCLVVAAVMMAMVAGIFSTPVKFKQMLAAVSWANMPRIVMAVLTIAVVLLKNPDDFNLRNPLMFNPGAFMDPITSNKFVLAIATALDLFTLWIIFLMATGIKAAGGKKLSFGSAVFAVVLPWLVVVLIGAG